MSLSSILKMLKFVALVCLIPAFVLAKDCGVRPAYTGKIVGGIDAYNNEFPWQVSWRYLNTTTNVHRHVCGGSIISDTWIVTAAHCVDLDNNVAAINPALFKALVGGHQQSTPSSNQKVIEIKQIIVHSGWNSQNINNDIAVVELQEPIGLENSNLNSICIGPASDNIEGQNAVISGWGLLKSGDTTIPDTLQRATVPVVLQSTCRSRYAIINPITDGMVCAGYAIGVCNGDSGGPLQYEKNGQWYLLGATSFGVGCGSTIFPGVFTRVPYYATFISSNTGVTTP